MPRNGFWMLGIGKKLVLDGLDGVFWTSRWLFWRKNLKIVKFAFGRMYAYFRPEMTRGLFLSCSPGPGDAFCTVGRPRNSFPADSGDFQNFPWKNIAKNGDFRIS